MGMGMGSKSSAELLQPALAELLDLAPARTCQLSGREMGRRWRPATWSADGEDPTREGRQMRRSPWAELLQPAATELLDWAPARTASRC
ncbi:hypothetical protein ZWY2020_004608 [Hordeum vulgare]|nr:hypothetical protein ZWY2020_004608 [Hordeum vulgare]